MTQEYPYNLPTGNQVRADLKPELFDSAILQKGYTVIWEQGMFCPCIDMRSGQPSYACPMCGGKGYTYFGAKETKSLITSISGNKDQDHIGLNEQGSAYLTPLSTDMVGFRDKFTLVDFDIKFSEVIARDETKFDTLDYQALKVIMVKSLTKEYVEGFDYIVAEDGKKIEWLTPMPTKERYSILYTTRPVYIAIGPVHDLRGTYTMAKGGGVESFVRLPSQFHIKREDLLDETFNAS
jgi:hypothetical protein